LGFLLSEIIRYLIGLNREMIHQLHKWVKYAKIKDEIFLLKNEYQSEKPIYFSPPVPPKWSVPCVALFIH